MFGPKGNEAWIMIYIPKGSTDWGVLSTVFRSKKDQVTEEWRKLHEELRNWRSSPNIVSVIKPRRMTRAGNVARTENAYESLVEKLEGKRPPGRPGRKWENNEMDLTEVGWNDVG